MSTIVKMLLIGFVSSAFAFDFNDEFVAEKVSNNTITSGSALTFGDGERPENALPGQCFAKVIIPAKFKYTNESVMVSPQETKISTIPAKYAYESKQVLVKEATERQVTVPATYKFVNERVLVQGESERLIQIPAKYKTVSKKIMVSPETTEWKKGAQPSVNSANEALCLVKKPAQYRTVYEKVLVEPARTETKVIPAVYNTVQKRVVDRPAFVKTIPVAAQYKTVKVRKMVEAPRTVENVIDAKFQNISKRVKVSESRTEWREVLCKTNANTAKVAKVQKFLKRNGYLKGKVDGLLGNGTARAIKKYQEAKGLPTGGLTFETMKDMKINL